MSQKIVTKLFRYALQAGANNLTISAEPGSLSVDCRLPGGGTWSLAVPPKLEADFLAVLRRLLDLAPGELVAEKYGKLNHKGCRLDFRLSVLPGKKGEKIILNVVNQRFRLWRLNQLGLTASQLSEARGFLRSRGGLAVISSGPQGGRSATLASLLLEVNDPSRNIYWVCGRDGLPSYEIPGVSYMLPTPANWERLLKHDSEVVFVDDADAGSIEYALRAAHTGRLVLMSWLAKDAKDSGARITEAAEREKVRGAVKLVIHQELADWPLRSAASRRGRDRIGRFYFWRA